jgi:hypothetical protein
VENLEEECEGKKEELERESTERRVENNGRK